MDIHGYVPFLFLASHFFQRPKSPKSFAPLASPPWGAAPQPGILQWEWFAIHCIGEVSHGKILELGKINRKMDIRDNAAFFGIQKT